MVEFTAVVFMFMVCLFGVIEAGFIYYQWNSATKAVQFGARLAAVSAPVPNNLTNYTGLSSTVLPGMPMPTFSWVCQATAANGSAGNCTGNIGGGGLYQPAPLRAIVFGRDSLGASRTQCEPAETVWLRRGMCNFYDKVQATNIIVRYDYTGLGYAGRPGGPVPTITVSLTGLTYNYVFLGSLLGLQNVSLPSYATTVTGEDLNANGS